MRTETDKSYAAGYFEARGYFKITLSGGRKGGPRVRVVANIHHKQAVWFVERWGGTLQRYAASASPQAIPSALTQVGHLWCMWVLSFDDAKVFLEDIYPYLQRKGKAAKLCAVFLHTLARMPVKLTDKQLTRLRTLALLADQARIEARET